MSEEDIANALMSVNDCLQVIGQRLDAIEQYVQAVSYTHLRAHET